MKTIMTPEQETKCDLLEVDVCEVGTYPGNYYVTKRGSGTFLLGKSSEYVMPVKLFSSVDEAIFAAADPAKLELRWSQ